MALEHEKIERLRDRMLTCPICLDEYKDPRMLPCHHSVCLSCLQEFVQASALSRSFRCPQCRSDVSIPRGGIADFPPNFYINCIQDEIGSRPNFGICNICKRDWLVLQYRCVDCDIDICKFCCHDHRLFGHVPGTQGNITKIKTGNLVVNNAPGMFCPEHKEECLKMFCLTCNTAVCVICVLEHHNKHNTMTLEKKLQNSNKSLQIELNTLQKDVKEVKLILKKLHDVEAMGDKSADATICQIHEYTQQVIHYVHKLADTKIDKVKEERGKFLKEIHVYEKDLEEYLNQLQIGTAFLSDLEEEDMCLELLQCFQKYKSKLELAQKSVVNKKIKQNYFVFTPGLVVNKFGCLWMSRSAIYNKVIENTIMPKAEKQPLFKKYLSQLSLTSIFSVLTCAFVFIGIGQFVFLFVNEGATVENSLCALLYGYLCVSAIFAYRKHRNV